MIFSLTDEQTAAVQASGPVCLTASAGSGKTAVLVERYVRALSQGISPQHILAVTFTRKAGAQLRERILKRLEGEHDELLKSVELTPWIGTLHHFCSQILNNWGRCDAFEPRATILDNLSWAAAAKTVLESWKKSIDPQLLEQAFAVWTPFDLEAMAQEILKRPSDFEKAFSKAVEPSSLLATHQDLFAKLVVQWRTYLRNNSLQTFDDLEDLVLKLFETNTAARETLSLGFKAVLVDEFQDTSPKQWAILEKLCHDNPKKLFVVGDPKQSIYRFRNADIELFLAMAQNAPKQGGTSLDLRTCFRSTPELVRVLNMAAQDLFANTPLLQNEMLPGQAAANTLPVRLHLFQGNTLGEAAEAERNVACDAAQDLIHQGISPEQIAFLFRNGDRMENFAEGLKQRSLLVACEPVVDLFSLYEVQDLCAYLRATLNPEDDFQLSAFLQTPYVGLSKPQLFDLAQKKGNTLFEKLTHSPWAKWWIDLVCSGECRTDEVLRHLFLNSKLWPARSGVVYTLAGKLVEATYLCDAVPLLAAWETQGVTIPSPLVGSSSEGIRLMTVHAAKGLEFGHVFILDNLRRPPTRLPWLLMNQDGKLGLRFRRDGEITNDPTYDELIDINRKQDTDESNRILYVALTRAKNTLHISLPANETLIPKTSWGDKLNALIRRGNLEVL